MRKTLFTIFLTSAAIFMASCGGSKTNDAEKSDAESEAIFVVEEGQEYTELTKVPLPCSKEELSAAWKKIGHIEASKGKGLDYKQHLPELFISTDLDGDGCPEVLLRGESPYAAIFTFAKDSLQLITFVDHAQIGLGITPDGIIVRSGTQRGGAFSSQFLKLTQSQISAVGETHETFSIQGNAMVSTGTKYFLQGDSAMVEVSQEAYQEVAPKQSATYLEDIEDWEDFRKP